MQAVPEQQPLRIAAPPPRLSVVVPLLNEAATLTPLYDEVQAAQSPGTRRLACSGCRRARTGASSTRHTA
jgi:hypothetical protein